MTSACRHKKSMDVELTGPCF